MAVPRKKHTDLFLWFCGLFIALASGLVGCNRPSGEPAKPSSDSPSESIISEKGNGKEESAQTGERFEERLAQAESWFGEGKFEEAWGVAKGLLVEQPQSVPALFLAARTMAARNNLQGAIQLISKIDPADPQAGGAALGQLAEWLAQSGDLPAAEVKLRALLKEYPTAVPALRLLIDVLHAQGRRWDASKVLDRLIRLGDFTTPDLMGLVDLREPVDQEKLRTVFHQAAPANPMSELGEVRLLLYADRWKDCVDRLRILTNKDPQQIEPWIWYGEALLETGGDEALEGWLKSAPEGYAKHPEYWYIIGRSQMLQSRWEMAARCFVEALKIDRRHLGGMQSLSECLMELKQEDLGLAVRAEAGKMVRIKDLTVQIQRGQAKDEAFFEIAKLYRELGDLVASFGWEAIALTQTRQRFPESLLSSQRDLRGGKSTPLPVLEKLPWESWPLPTSEDAVKPSGDPSRSKPSIAPGDETTIRLTDAAKRLGIEAAYQNGAGSRRSWYTLEGIGGGVSALDYDRDGWPDLYYSQAGDSPVNPMPKYLPKQLFRSLAGQRFQEVQKVARTDDLGYGQGTGVADLDQDGFDDLLIANIGGILWLRNQGDGTFEAMPFPQAPSTSIWNSAIQAADLNGDSLPDVIQCGYIDGDSFLTRTCPTPGNPDSVFCHPKRFEAGKTRILFNRGDGEWQLADSELLGSLSDGYALGAVITDIDQQAGNDVFIANDVSPNHFLLSKRDESGERGLEESAIRSGVAVDLLGRAQASMGIACGDQNRDGMLDLIVTNFRYEVSTLYLQTRPGIFVDATRGAKLGEATLEWLSFGCQLSDLDNDGWLDFITVNGHIDYLEPWQMPPQVLRNRRGVFEWLRKPSPGEYFDRNNVGRSLTAFDLNRDGKMDFAVTHLDRPTAVLVNESESPYHYVQLELIGTKSERGAVGTIVRLDCGDEKWVAAVAVGDGFYGTNERVLHVGVGGHTKIDRIEVEWPSGQKEALTGIEADRRYQWIEGITAGGL